MTENAPEMIFKGMRSSRYRDVDVLLGDAISSPYFLWWSCLRRSKDYWWVCRRNGIADDMRLRHMYNDFGMIYEMTFEQWWEQRGINLFSEQIALPAVRMLNPHKLQLSKGMNTHLLLEIPLHMTERTIIAQVRAHLRQHPQQEVQRVTTARRKLSKLIGIRQDVIESALEVWRVHHQSRDGRQVDKIGQAKGNKSLYQIGKELKLVDSCMPAATDNKERAAKRVNGMKVAVSRMLARANNLIENAAAGTFPSVQTLKTSIVWRPIAQERLAEAVATKRWHPLFDANEVLIVP
jgi:hypothetical protein